MSEKLVEFLRHSTPESPAIGYGDHVIIHDSGKALYGCHASTCPNPYKKVDDGPPRPWRSVYAMLAEGEYVYWCKKHDKFGKCLMLNNGQECPTINNNVNHGGRRVATGIFVHRGGLGSVNPKWRGSKGCLTIAPEDWERFIGCFALGEVGRLVIRKMIENHPVDIKI